MNTLLRFQKSLHLRRLLLLAILAWAWSSVPVFAQGTPSASSTPVGTASPNPKPLATSASLPFLLPTATPVPVSTPVPPLMSVEEYRSHLKNAIQALSAFESHPPRTLQRFTQILAPLNKAVRLKRADGEVQTASGDEWHRRITEIGQPSRTAPTNTQVTRNQVSATRQAIEYRLKALDTWVTPQDGAYYQSSNNATSLVQQMESNGEIRTGPTRLQQLYADVMKWIGDTFTNFLKWIGRLFPSAPVKTPTTTINPQVLWVLFGITVVGLLGLIGYLVWRSIGGNWRREGAHTDVRFVGEDADLLQLPPDELTDRARAWAEQGNFREALRHLYIALLLYLDEQSVWNYDSRRTNWEHISALRRAQLSSIESSKFSPEFRRNLVNPLSDLTRRFDRVRYGNADCDRDDWTRFLSDVEMVRSTLTKGAPASSHAPKIGVKSL